MNNYDIIIEDEAYRNLDEIFSYITYSFASIDTAEKILTALEDAIYSLRMLPERGALRKTGSYADMGFRQLLSGNYIIVYEVDSDRQKVHVLTVQPAMRKF